MSKPHFLRDLSVARPARTLERVVPGQIVSSTETHLAVVGDDLRVRWVERVARGWGSPAQKSE